MLTCPDLDLVLNFVKNKNHILTGHVQISFVLIWTSPDFGCLILTYPDVIFSQPPFRKKPSATLRTFINKEWGSFLALGWMGVALFFKEDMMEFITTFGFPSWGTVAYPCPLCVCTLAGMGLAQLDQRGAT